VGAGKFCAHQHDLRRVVHPDQNNDERSRRAKARFKTLFPYVEADQEFADFE
jgi:hypothetical protein